MARLEPVTKQDALYAVNTLTRLTGTVFVLRGKTVYVQRPGVDDAVSFGLTSWRDVKEWADNKFKNAMQDARAQGRHLANIADTRFNCLGYGDNFWNNAVLSVKRDGIPVTIPSTTAQVVLLQGERLAIIDGDWVSALTPERVHSQNTLSISEAVSAIRNGATVFVTDDDGTHPVTSISDTYIGGACYYVAYRKPSSPFEKVKTCVPSDQLMIELG